MDKQQLRKQIKQIIADMSLQKYKQLSYTICQKALKERVVLQSNLIAVTISNKPEVDLTTFIEALWKMGKRVAVPKCNPLNKEMSFHEIQHFSQLEIVYMNLREPIIEQTKRVEAQEIDVMIVPGVVFDIYGYRVGYGGGFYDRYLMSFTGELLALAFDEQLQTTVPKESHDIPVNLIITQSHSINCLENRKGS